MDNEEDNSIWSAWQSFLVGFAIVCFLGFSVVSCGSDASTTDLSDNVKYPTLDGEIQWTGLGNDTFFGCNDAVGVYAKDAWEGGIAVVANDPNCKEEE